MVFLYYNIFKVSKLLFYSTFKKALIFMQVNYFWHKIKNLIKPVAYSSRGSQTGQLDFCKWLADNVISITLRQV